MIKKFKCDRKGCNNEIKSAKRFVMKGFCLECETKDILEKEKIK